MFEMSHFSSHSLLLDGGENFHIGRHFHCQILVASSTLPVVALTTNVMATSSALQVAANISQRAIP
jgi:hypothetical protein